MTEQHRPYTPPNVSELFLSFLRLGSVSFGGPAMVTYIKALAVAKKKWLSEDDFKQGTALCQAVPGATAMQCAAFVGLRARGLRGALATYVGFGLPAFVLMLGFSIAYQHAVKLDVVTSILFGLRAIVVALIANSAWTFIRSSVKKPREAVIAAAASLLFLISDNPFLIVAAAGLSGTLWLRGNKQEPRRQSTQSNQKTFQSMVLLAAFCVALLAVLFFCDRQLLSLGLVMMKIDLFAFGGGFASVPLMYQEIVETHRWMPAGMFMDGIALGQVTPGPIVITAAFAGFQIAGVVGAIVATVCIFLPSLLIVVSVDPWFSRFQTSDRFQGASRAFVLSFVGLLVSVTFRFAWATPWTIQSAAIGAAALTALLCKIDIVWVVLGGAAVSALIL
jgi:chromate transporter